MVTSADVSHADIIRNILDQLLSKLAFLDVQPVELEKLVVWRNQVQALRMVIPPVIILAFAAGNSLPEGLFLLDKKIFEFFIFLFA